MIIRRRVQTSIEERIVSLMITNSSFLRDIYKVVDPEYFSLEFLRPIVRWCIRYWKEYQVAPQEKIKDMLRFETKNLEAAERQLIAKFIDGMEEVETGKDHKYILKESMRYLSEREIRGLVEEIETDLKLGDVEEAEKRIKGYRNSINKITGTWSNPLDMETILRTFDRETNEVFIPSGKLGKAIGPVRRGWLIAIIAPMKRAKTWLMRNLGMDAVFDGCKVAEISFEMAEEDSNLRHYMRLTAKPSEETSNLLIPMFDCKSNQENTCRNPRRRNRLGIFVDGMKLDFEEADASGYEICTICREKRPELFLPTLWWSRKESKVIDELSVIREAKNIRYMGVQKNWVSKHYPRFGATVSEAIQDLELLIANGFYPNVILWDYPKITRPDTSVTGVEAVDEIWKTIAGFAQRTGSVIIAPHQGTRGSLGAKYTREEHTSGFIDILAHIDLALTISQTDEEAELGITRIGVPVHRHKKALRKKEVLVLQSLAIGQPVLDAEILENDYEFLKHTN